MPRQAHGRPLQPGKANTAGKKKTARNRGLNALEIAERENPETVKIRRHRLGEVDDENEQLQDRASTDERSSKRRKIDTTQGDDLAEEGSDLEGNRWHEGVDEDDDDSDIDSEDAFGASDEERFADFSFRGNARNPSAPKTRGKSATKSLDEHDLSVADDNEDAMDGQESEEFESEAIDLATAWDMDDQDEEDIPTQRRKSDSDDEEPSSASEDHDDDDNEEHDTEDEMSDFSVSDDEGDHSRLQDFVKGLPASEQAKTLAQERHVHRLPDKPSQFGLSSTKVSAADILQYIKDPRQRQSLKIMQNIDERGHEPYKNGIPGKLAPPLAKRQQDRLDRSAAYEESKKELGKWTETVKQNRRAEHLSFPLVDAAAVGMLSGKQLGPTVTTEPMTSLESTIQRIMVESGMLSKDQTQEGQEQAYEELHEKQLPLEEVQARRAELRRARDLMFREEIRARRIKKIKSKAYRRVHRKEREKADQQNVILLAAQGLLNSDEEREKNDRRRAEERMGARHRESKWAKGVKATGRAAWDDDARHGVTDLARRDEELRRRIEGKPSNDSDASNDSFDFDGFSASEDDRWHIDSKLDGLDTDEADVRETRLGSMAFMKRAEAARNAANREETQRIRRSLRNDATESGGEADTEEDSAPAGRQKFGSMGKEPQSGPQPEIKKSEFEEPGSELDDDPKNDGKENDGQTNRSSSALDTSQVKSVGRETTNALVPKQGPAKYGLLHSATEKASASKTSTAVIAKNKAPPLLKKSKVSETQLDDYTSPSESEDDHDEQTVLARAIFAGSDEIGKDFANEKKETVVEEGDQIIDNGLPGWGSWAGEGISKKAQKRAKGRFLTTTKGVAEDKRQDAKLDKVIINEKRIKKNSKYLASELPHPFESRHQYERSLRLPLGPEWTTKSTFQDATKPRVMVKQGIIRPMTKPLA